MGSIERLAYIATLIAGVLTGVSLVGCGPTIPEWKPEDKQLTFAVAHQHHAPQPVYNRLRWVMPPENMPSRTTPTTRAPKIFLIMHLDMPDATLEEATLVLAASTRYSSYCPPSIGKKKISINSLGTVDELVRELSKVADVEITVDHANREIAVASDRPRFLDSY